VEFVKLGMLKQTLLDIQLSESKLLRHNRTIDAPFMFRSSTINEQTGYGLYVYLFNAQSVISYVDLDYLQSSKAVPSANSTFLYATSVEQDVLHMIVIKSTIRS
jgi:hypothetical protein